MPFLDLSKFLSPLLQQLVDREAALRLKKDAEVEKANPDVSRIDRLMPNSPLCFCAKIALPNTNWRLSALRLASPRQLFRLVKLNAISRLLPLVNLVTKLPKSTALLSIEM